MMLVVKTVIVLISMVIIIIYLLNTQLQYEVDSLLSFL